MRTFSFFIEDERSSVPTLEFVTVKTLGRARALAAERLASSAHHLSVEVVDGERLLFRLARPEVGNSGEDVRPLLG